MTKTVIINGEEWPIISEYTMDQAIEDGILIEVGEVQREDGTKIRVVFTRTLFEEGGYEDKTKRSALVTRGMELLKNSDPEDTDYMRLRVIEKGKIWVIHEELLWLTISGWNVHKKSRSISAPAFIILWNIIFREGK